MFQPKRRFDFLAIGVLLATAIFLPTNLRAGLLYYPNAVTSGLTLSALTNQGWIVLYNVTYATATTTADVNSWRTAAGTGYIFMGGTDASGNVLLGASGLASEVLTPTSSTTVANAVGSSAMYWYNKTGYSVGFADTSSVALGFADTGSSDPNYRLSWHLDLGAGGYRLGSLTGLNADTTYRKIVLMSPHTPTFYPNGVTNNLTLSTLTNQGWKVVYNVTYATHTTTADVNSWRTAAGGGYIFMGGTDASGNVLLGASGLASEVLNPTSSITVANAVSSSVMYWYNYSPHSIGFADTSTVDLFDADFGNNSDNYRLSWHLDNANGGWRLGTLTGLNSDTTHYKIVLTAPVPLNLANVDIHRAVYLDASNLLVGANYVLQVSTNLTTWTNSGTFTSTNAFWRSTDWDVTDWNSLFFRLIKL